MDNIVKKGFPPPFIVRTSGWIRNQPYHSTPGTKDDDVMLTVFLSGKGTYVQGRDRHIVSSGMVGLVFPEARGVLAAHPANPYSHLYCRFNGDYAIYLARKIFISRGTNFFYFKKTDELADLLRPMGLQNSQYRLEQMGRREVMLIQALLLLSGSKLDEQSPVLSKHSINDYLNQHIAEPTDLEKMAEHFQVSKSTLCRTAKKNCSKTVQRLHEEMKMEWAKVLLKSQICNISEVALRVGYSDPLYFSRVFRKNCGTSPQQWQFVVQ